LSKPLSHQKFTLESISDYGDIWQFVLENLLSIRVFKSHGDIFGYYRFAWTTVIDHLWKIMPIGMCDWVNRFKINVTLTGPTMRAVQPNWGHCV